MKCYQIKCLNNLDISIDKNRLEKNSYMLETTEKVYKDYCKQRQ